MKKMFYRLMIMYLFAAPLAVFAPAASSAFCASVTVHAGAFWRTGVTSSIPAFFSALCTQAADRSLASASSATVRPGIFTSNFAQNFRLVFRPGAHVAFTRADQILI